MFDLDEALSRVDAMLAAGRPEQAEQLARTVIAQHPDVARAHASLADALDRQRRHEEAVAPAREALRLRPEQPGPHLAMALTNVGESEEAIEHARRGVALLPHDPEAHDVLALAILESGDKTLVSQALAASAESIRIDPNVGRAHSILGLGHKRAGDHAAAREAFHRALAIDPSDTTALNNLATMDLGVGRWLRGTDTMQSALSIAPNAPGLHENIRILLWRCGVAFTALWALAGLALTTMLVLDASHGTRVITGCVWLAGTGLAAAAAQQLLPRTIRLSPRGIIDFLVTNEKYLLGVQVIPVLGVAVMAFAPGLVAAIGGGTVLAYLLLFIMAIVLRIRERNEEKGTSGDSADSVEARD
ncbi:Flp pilus assembly protein TadD [Nocardioides daedukensis]|uniref:Flp pilus assembly protein TadD n=1 Tax=Nocardioides daedukensis TaxID=634462 RepID=A0A7Y9RZJ3_9ACTN|nr:tetratricopeptide repeat protein [Nocardioides daedukensis]NYG59125.1 Flp pilus assembly protein TadD [Nocardioides daedukensis]